MIKKTRKPFCIVLSVIIVACSITTSTTKNVNADPGISVTTDKYNYYLGETVKITLDGDLMLSSITDINYIGYIIRDSSGNYVKEQLTLNYWALCAIGFWYGPLMFDWNQTYLVYKEHNGSLIQPIYIPPTIPPTGEQIPPGKYYVYFSLNGKEITGPTEIEITGPTVIEGIVNIDPDTLNLRSRGRWIACYIQLPQGYYVNDIDINTVMLMEGIPVQRGEVGSNTLMVKFDRGDVQDLIGSPCEEIEFIITGEITDGPNFEGSDTIRAINP